MGEYSIDDCGEDIEVLENYPALILNRSRDIHNDNIENKAPAMSINRKIKLNPLTRLVR